MSPKKEQGQEEKEEEIAGEKTIGEDSEEVSPELEEALREKEQFRNLAQRVQADFINYKHRMEEGRKEIEKFAKSELLLKVLSIVDDFQRALSHLPQEDMPPQWLEGIQLIQRKLQSFLGTEGVKKIEALGFDFNPEEHEAVFYEETSNNEEGKVISVVRDGYKLHDRVLRPAQVSVGKRQSDLKDKAKPETSEEER